MRWPDGRRQLEYDEVIAMLFARHDLLEIVRATAADTMPPLYYWLLHLWGGGYDVAWARGLSLLFGVAAIPVVYLLGRHLLGEVPALAGAGLMALSPFPVFYGHFARMYALLALLGLLAVLFFNRWLGGGRRRDLFAFTLCAGLSLYVHNLGLLLIVALDVLFLLERKNAWRPLAAAHVAMVIAYAPWLLYLPGQLEKVNRAFWIPTPGLTELVRTPMLFLFHLPLPDVLVPPAAFVGLLCLAITIAETRRRWLAAPRARGGLLSLAAVAAAPVVLMYAVSFIRPIYVERAVLASAGAYYLLLAGAFWRMPIRPLALTVTAVVLVAGAAAHGYQYGYESFPRSPYYALADQLGSQVRPGEVLLHDNKLSYFPTYLLAPDLPQAYLPDPPGSPNDTLAQGTIDVLRLPPMSLEQAVAGRQRIWFVLYKRSLDEASGSPANKVWLDQRYRSDQATQIGDLLVYIYYVGTL